MKVLLVANYVPDAQTSMQAFRHLLERELPRQGCEVRVVAPARVLHRFASGAFLEKWLGYLDKFVLFYPRLRGAARWADVVHVCDHSNSMYVPWVEDRPTVVTCHDVIAIQAARGMVPGWQVGASGRLFQRLISRGIGRADVVSCVSALTRRDLLAMKLADPARVESTPNGLNQDFHPVPAAQADALLQPFGLAGSAPYLLHVGLDLPRKNRGKVLETFIALLQRSPGRASPVERLVFVGPALSPEMAERARQAGVVDRVVVLSKVSHEALRALYSRAHALLFPSLQEGFGWPVIEAQACGCPVFTSDRAPMNEIGGDGAVYVDPDDPAAMAQAILSAAPQRERMRERGLENAPHYSGEGMAAKYVADYRVAIARHGAAR